ncbi:MAG: hypothetical protein V3V10_08025 [Planctomycetota bacterium]
MRYLIPLLMLTTLAGCFADTQRPVDDLSEPDSSAKPKITLLISEEDRGEQALIQALFKHARNGDVDGAKRVTSTHVQKEAKAVHAGLPNWLSTMSEGDYEFGILYSREGASGRWQVVNFDGPNGKFEIAFYITKTASSSAKEIDNVLSIQPVMPLIQPALASSRTHILRAFWAYYGALTAQAPEYLPEQTTGAPVISQRLRLTAFRSSTSPALRQRLLQTGPDHTRKHVPAYLDVMSGLLENYNQPEVRKADLLAGHAVLLFSPTDKALQEGRTAFMLEFTSGWYHGMQVLTSERKFVG